MRQCGICRRSPRQDDRLDCHHFTAEDGAPSSAAACRECIAATRGLGWGDPRYPVEDCPTLGLPFVVCGVCRLACREGDTGEAMRLAPSDVADTDILPGCYLACRDCVARFRPVIWARLRATGVLGPLSNPSIVAGNWLL